MSNNQTPKPSPLVNQVITNQPLLNTSLKVGMASITALLLASCATSSDGLDPYKINGQLDANAIFGSSNLSDGNNDDGNNDDGNNDDGNNDDGNNDDGNNDDGNNDDGNNDDGNNDDGNNDDGNNDDGNNDDGNNDDGNNDDGNNDDGNNDDGNNDDGNNDDGNGGDDTTPNTAEADKSGAQSLSIDPTSAGLATTFVTTTRDFTATDTNVNARADTASNGLLPIVDITVSGADDNDLQNGFKQHTDSTKIPTGLGELPLTYESVYKDFSDDMRIGHIDGKATLNESELPVDGVAVIGNATKAENVPTEGTINYEGDATYRKLGIGNDIEYGESVFTADFVNKKVMGDLKFENVDDISLTATIDGNEFSGSAEDNSGYATEGGFYGGDADSLGGIYSNDTAQGTYGAEKQEGGTTDPITPTDPVDPDVAPDSEMTGFQSSTFSSLKANSSGVKQFEDAVGYVAIRDDKSDFTETQSITSADGVVSEVPVDNRKGDNFTSFDVGVVRGDLVQPASFKKPIAVNLKSENGTVKVEADLSVFNPDFNYKTAYENFENQMQVGHVYGVINSGVVGDASRVANVYVQGHSTAQADLDYLAKVNEGKAKYTGKATYIENIHLGDSGSFEPVNGTSAFDVDFVNNSVKGELSFNGEFKYNPTGKVGIEAIIDGNTFTGNNNGIDTAGGFYGEDAKYIGGIYQDASVEGGKGTVAGTGTKFQGTFGAMQGDTPITIPDPETPVEPETPVVETDMTGFQSTAVSSVERQIILKSWFGDREHNLDGKIAYGQIRDDQSGWSEKATDQSVVDNRNGDNFTSFKTAKVLADMAKPNEILASIDNIEIGVEEGSVLKVQMDTDAYNTNFNYNSSVYKNFDDQLQVGHIFGNINSSEAGDLSRVSNVYVQGYLTTQAGIDALKQVNEGKAQYSGVATYMENLNLGDFDKIDGIDSGLGITPHNYQTQSAIPINGTSNFDVDFVNNSVKGELEFAAGDYKYMPEGNKIGIQATINGNTFTGNVNSIDTAGGFYGENAKFLGGIYQDASVEGGKGTVAGTGTKFQGTFGAEQVQ